MAEESVKFGPYDSLPSDGFRIDAPYDWDEYRHNEPVPGDSYYYYPAPDDAGGFSVYVSRSEVHDVADRLALEGELADFVEVLSRTKVEVDGLSAEKLIYKSQETVQAGNIVDENGLLVHVESQQQLLYAVFCFVQLEEGSFVFGYKVREDLRQVYQPILDRMLASLRFLDQ